MKRRKKTKAKNSYFCWRGSTSLPSFRFSWLLRFWCVSVFRSVLTTTTPTTTTTAITKPTWVPYFRCQAGNTSDSKVRHALPRVGPCACVCVCACAYVWLLWAARWECGRGRVCVRVRRSSVWVCTWKRERERERVKLCLSILRAALFPCLVHFSEFQFFASCKSFQQIGQKLCNCELFFADKSSCIKKNLAEVSIFFYRLMKLLNNFSRHS